MRLPTVILSAVHAVMSYFHNDLELDTLLTVIGDHQLTPEIRHHLKQMFRTVVWILASFVFGFHLRLNGYIGGLLAGFGSSVCVIWFRKIYPWRTGKRVCVLITGAMFGGALVGPCFSSFLNADFDSVEKALIGAFLSLGWFEATHFYLFSFSTWMLSNPVDVLLIIFITIVAPQKLYLYYLLQNYTWILYFLAYVAVYSRVLMRQILDGDHDYVNHAITLFTIAPAVCLRMFYLMFWGTWLVFKTMVEESHARMLERRSQRQYIH